MRAVLIGSALVAATLISAARADDTPAPTSPEAQLLTTAGGPAPTIIPEPKTITGVLLSPQQIELFRDRVWACHAQQRAACEDLLRFASLPAATYQIPAEPAK